MKHKRGYRKIRRCLGALLVIAILAEGLGMDIFVSKAAETPEEVSSSSLSAESGTPEKMAEDLFVTSNYVLEEDMVVENLYITGNLDLKGYQLKVLGNMKHSGGIIQFNKGQLLCTGNYVSEGNSSMDMQNENDYMSVGGSFTCQSNYCSSVLTAGTIEIKGDFFQKQNTYNTASQANFISMGTHKTIFSGDGGQKIQFDSPASYFNKVILKNKSEEGIHSHGVINSLSMERGSTKIETEIVGRYGWKLTKDEVIDGNLVLIGDTLDLNGCSLTVTGHLIHMNGTININGGCLNVGADYRLQSNSGDNEFAAASALLMMKKVDDKVKVEGDFITQSTVSHSEYLQQGVLEVKGNVEQKRTRKTDNLSMTCESTLCLSGNEKQKLVMESSGRTDSKLAGLDIQNKAGVELDTDIYVTGNVSDYANPVTGKSLVIQDNTTFTNHSFSGNILTKDSFILKELENIGGNYVNTGNVRLGTNLKVRGNLDTRCELFLNGYQIETLGDVSVIRNLTVDKGKLICEGDFRLEEGAGGAQLIMNNQEDYVLVKGSFYAHSSHSSNSRNMSAGTLEIKGNFEHTSPGSKGNLCVSGTHIVKFSGEQSQVIRFADDSSYFNHVEIMNLSEEGVYAPNGIHCSSLNRNGCKVTTNQVGEFGWTLTADEVYEGDLYLISDELNLNGHRLQVNGNLIQSAGTVTVNRGELVVEGDYRIQSEIEQDGTVTYGKSLGMLQMLDESDRVTVKGAFAMGSTYSHKGKLTAGVLTVGGNFSAFKYGAADNMTTTGSHLLVLNGIGNQSVNLAEPSFSKMRIANVKMENAKEQGIVFESIFPVSGNVYQNDKKPSGELMICSSTVFENGEYRGDILANQGGKPGNLSVLSGKLTTGSTITLSQNLVVDGNLFVSNGAFGVNGNELTVTGDICISYAYLMPGKGTCICNGDMTLEYNSRGSSYLSMLQKEDYVLVKGNFYARSTYAPEQMKEGILEIKGNFVHEKTGNEKGFVATENHKVIFSGDRLQTVDFASDSSYFSRVEILNTSEEGVYSEKGIHCQYLETYDNQYRTGLVGENGWKLEADEQWDGDLVLTAGTLDLQGRELTVNGNLIQKGGSVKVNGGRLIVNGDYQIGQTGADENGRIGCWGTLQMVEQSDEVIVKGDFMTASFVDHSSYLTHGILSVSGDLIQKAPASKRNLATSSEFMLIMDGDDIQTADMETVGSKCSRIANLTIKNTSEKGVFLNGMLVTGKVIVKEGTPYGELCAASTTEFENDFYEGDVCFKEYADYKRTLHIKGFLQCNAGFTMRQNITIDGNFRTCGNVELLGNTLQVNGAVNICGAVLNVNKGKVVCAGDMNLEYHLQRASGFEMLYDEDYVLVCGDLNVDTSRNFWMTRGTLELKGDLFQNRYSGSGAFRPESTFTTVLSGQEKQSIRFSDANSRLCFLRVLNQSEEGVFFENETIRAEKVERNGCRVTCNGAGTYGWTLQEDTVIQDDLYIIMDELNLNGHSLTINGNLYIGSGSVRINEGKLDISGDLKIQAVDENGVFSAGSGTLVMNNEKDLVRVGRDFVIQTSQKPENQLTAGTLEIKGSFYQKKVVGMNRNFVASGTHNVIFSGEAEQKVCFEGGADCGFMNVCFTDAAQGVHFTSNARVFGQVEDARKKAVFDKDKYMFIDTYAQLKDGIFGGNTRCRQQDILLQDVCIRGVVFSNTGLDLNGHKMKAGCLQKSNGKLDINSGELLTGNSLDISSYGYLCMEDDKDKISVKGDFRMSSVSGNNLMTAGILEICGDVSITGSAFVPSGSHQTVLCGKAGKMGRDYVQTISVGNTGSRFHELVLTKNRDRFYSFSADIDTLCDNLILLASDEEAPAKVEGLCVKKTDAVSVNLEWKNSEDNESAVSYQIFRGSSMVGETEDTSYTDAGLRPEQNYSYVIYAVDESGNISEASQMVTAVTEEDMTAPDKPGEVKLLTRTGSSMTIGWKRAKDNVGVAGYRVYREGEVIAETDAKTYQYKDINRCPEEENHYQVTAFDEAGNESESSTTVKGSAKMPMIVSTVPKSGMELGGECAVLRVDYRNVGNSTGNRVRFEYSTDEGKIWHTINPVLLGQNTCDYATLYSRYTWDISKIREKNCLIRMTVYDEDGNSAERVISCRLDSEPPSVPECVNVESHNGLVELSWNPSDSANCVRYEIYRAEMGKEFVKKANLEGRENTLYSDRDVTEESSYSYYVKAVDSYGLVSEQSEAADVTVERDMESPKVLEISSDSERLNQTTEFSVKAVDNIQTASVSMQYLYEDEWVDIGKETVAGGVGKCLFDTTTLADGEYSFRAFAEDRNGNISDACVQKFVIDNSGVGKVQLGESCAFQNKVRLTWKALSDDDIDCYAVEQLKDGEYEEVAREKNLLGTYIEGLKADTDYTFRVVGYDDVGNRGENSEQIHITTKKDTILPYVLKMGPEKSYFNQSVPIEITVRDNNELANVELSYSMDKKVWTTVDSAEIPSRQKEYIYSYDMNIENLPDGKFYIRAVVYDRQGNKNTEGQAIRMLIKVTKAMEPIEEIGAEEKDGYIVVNWKRPEEDRFESFDLYRKAGVDGIYECVDEESTALNYIDQEGEDGQDIYYKIVVNDQAGNKSEYSKEIKATVLPDIEVPKVYGVAPTDGKKVGKNPEIRALAADNRQLKSVSMEFRKKGGEDLWTQMYQKAVKADSKFISVIWKNASLENGDYEFRISAEDRKGNISSEYIFSYQYDKEYEEEKVVGPVSVPEQPEEEQEAFKTQVAAVLPADYSLRQGKEEVFDGTDSWADLSITDWEWDFGNGDTAHGERVSYAYPEEGTYELTLTVKDVDGNKDSVTSSVVVCPKSSGGVSVSVQDDTGAVLGNSQVYIEKAGQGKGTVYRCNAEGELEMALKPGNYRISAYQSKHLPVEKEVKINPGAVKKVNFTLESKEVVSGTLKHRKLDVKELMELGVDLTDPDNWYTYTYRVVTYLRGEPSPKIHEFNVSDNQWTFTNEGGGGVGRVGYTSMSIPDGGENDRILVRYETSEYLKQMFEVELNIQNLADEKFVMTKGKASLILPEGLNLIGMQERPQAETVSVKDIAGKSEQSIKWYIRGDRPGEYAIQADYNGMLQPFGAPVGITVRDDVPIIVTEENTNTNTDKGFLDPEKETKNYQILVTNGSGVGVKGAYVEMSYGDLSTRGITDGEGFVWLEVNEGEDRIFRLTAQCDGYQNYEDEEYKVNHGDYMDTIHMVEGEGTPFTDKNKDYEGDFVLNSVFVNGIDVFSKEVEINCYEDKKNTMKLSFNENVSEVAVLIKGMEEDNYVNVVSKEGLSSNCITIDFNSNKLVKGYEMFVRAVDTEKGDWHIYRLDGVNVVYEKQGITYQTEHYNQELAEQCALYSALAYKIVKKENGKLSDGFSCNYNTGFLSDKVDINHPSGDSGFVDLKQKLDYDDFVIDDKYMYINYYEDGTTVPKTEKENNCSYSICHRKLWNGKNLIYVIIRGTDSVEWYGNMQITGESFDASQEYHSSFKHAEEGVYNKLKEYIQKKCLNNSDIVTTGHSRGAAVANLLAMDLIDNKVNKEQEFEYNTVTAYTFATPYNTLKDDVNLQQYNNIYNFCFLDDFVPQVPMESWGYKKYGQTITADSEELHINNRDFNKCRRRIRSEDKKITYASEKTQKLIEHISKKWKNAEEYYKKTEIFCPILLAFPAKEYLTLYQFMRNKVAEAITTDNLPLLLYDGFKIGKSAFLIGESSNLHLVAKYFLKGSDLFDNYIFDTHNIDNYYAALISGGFDTSQFKSANLGNDSKSKKVSAVSPKKRLLQVSPASTKTSGDIDQFKSFLESERDAYNGDGEIVKMPVYEMLGWDSEDTSTWEGITITDGRITAIELPLVQLGGKLDLSGFDKLESLECIYSGFDEVLLNGCCSLKEIMLCGNVITTLDLQDCSLLESVDISDNNLTKIQWGEYASLEWMKCEGNYLDTDTDEELLAVVQSLKDKGISPSYKWQRYDETAEFNQDDVDFVKELLAQGENSNLLDWNPNDISTWSGIQWKTVAGKNYINRIDVARKDLTGSLVASKLKYVREIVCGMNDLKELNISGCRYLEFVSCYAGKLETLTFGNNDSLIYLDCQNNWLAVEDIEMECKKIASREGSEVYYERQYINADRVAFCESECEALEQFANLPENKDILNWDLEHPGLIPNVEWTIVGDEYRVKQISFLGYKVKGELDLSGFENLKQVCLVGTEVSKVILPANMECLEGSTFMNCHSLEMVVLPEKIKTIGAKAFYNCGKLSGITLPNSLQEIQEEAFVNCESLKEVTFGEAINVLGNYAFAGCVKLEKAVFMGDAPELLGSDIFYRTPEGFCVHYDVAKNGWKDEYWVKYKMVSGEYEPENPGEQPELPQVSPEPTKEPETVTPSQTEEPKETLLPLLPEIPVNKIPNQEETQNQNVANTDISKKRVKSATVKVKKVKVLKYGLRKRILKVVIKRDKKVSGYEVLFRKGKKGKYKVIRKKNWKKNKVLLRNLKKRNIYYVKVRAYKMVGKKTYYSGFTKCRKIKIR